MCRCFISCVCDIRRELKGSTMPRAFLIKKKQQCARSGIPLSKTVWTDEENSNEADDLDNSRLHTGFAPLTIVTSGNCLFILVKNYILLHIFILVSYKVMISPLKCSENPSICLFSLNLSFVRKVL